MPQPNHNGQKFYDALRDIFVGAKVEGESGYINLMRIKSRYFTEGVFPRLQKTIDDACQPFDAKFREELFDKLYTFFGRYFSESGSIYFRYTPLHQNVYEKVYTDDKDVILFWKTHMLYYVKTDRLFNDLDVEVDNIKFFFDVSAMEHKKSNEKRELIYTFKERRGNGVLVFNVAYSEKGRKTKVEEILRALKNKEVKASEDQLERAFRVFEKQSEVDYFINKNAKAFLCEQFDLWMYQYAFTGESTWTETRIAQLQTLKKITYKIIDFISQFENELVKIWNKPKFVLNSNYVITLDKIFDKDAALVDRLFRHTSFKAQLDEWKQLGIVDDAFRKSNAFENTKHGLKLAEKYRYLPIDTKHFKDLELEILSLFENLDDALDGWLIKSENYQALKTTLAKFHSRVQTIYIDPPYNTDASEIIYANNYKDSSWMTLIENRIYLAKQLLNGNGILCVTIDDSELNNLRSLLDYLFGDENLLGTVAIRNNPAGRSTAKGFSIAHEYALFVGDNPSVTIGRLERTPKQIARYGEADEIGSFEWVNFRKHGGANALRTARPKLFYPIYVTENSIRIPQIEWDEKKRAWIPLEPKRNDETILYPVSVDGEEKTWKWGHKSVLKDMSNFTVRRDQGKELAVYMKSRLKKEGTLPLTFWDKAIYSASDYGTNLLKNLFGEGQLFSFPKSVYATADCLKVANADANAMILDFFGGSGTTAHATINLNRTDGGKRKYILVEMDDHFDTVILPRIKKVVFCENWKAGKAAGGKGISHFCKYYSLEQYEDALRRLKNDYGDAPLFDNPYQDPYNQYVFLRDVKMLDALEVDLKANRVKLDLSHLYKGIDVAETLSNLTGKWIKRVAADYVEFTDGENVDLKNLDWEMFKPLIWW